MNAPSLKLVQGGRPEYPIELEVARALLRLKRTAPDLRGSLRRAVKYAKALDQAEQLRRGAA